MNGLLVGVVIVVIILLIMIVAGMYWMMRALGDVYTHLQNKKDRTDQSLQRMGTQLEQVRIDTNVNLERSVDLAQQMHAVTEVMSNAKRRGTWGEYQLDNLVRTYLGDSPYIYSTQFHLANGKISDGAFHLPQTDQVLCIDSKFPMENYLRMCDEPESAEFYEKEFRRNIKKHINDVASKYINEQTLDEALLFIPSEAVYAYICGEGVDLLNYALSQHVLLVSPTTLCGVVFSLQASTKNFYRAANMQEFEKQVRSLELRAGDLCERAGKTCRTSALLQKQLADLQNSAEKLLALIEQSAAPVLDDAVREGTYFDDDEEGY